MKHIYLIIILKNINVLIVIGFMIFNLNYKLLNTSNHCINLTKK